ncbi:hypothetical protein [Laspinema olomoucense]|uniref:restriction endonuclease-related protein n=1 Tax=Laspinema olomoucense TaxID=3231600 RepID=UPI0021BAEA60|nr:hypothetical protein [Laspinema sp. D3c]MCT7992567.1 hypothetical protein [Laspinema sp. D3c]
MYFEEIRQWQGTAEGLTKELKQQVKLLGLSVEPPALRTVRMWRAKQLLSQPKGQEFRFRQILEGLAVLLLQKRGWTLAAIAEVLPSFPDGTLEMQIIAEANCQDPSWSPVQTTSLPLSTGHAKDLDLAEDAVVLLAQGILRQYTRVLNREIVRQDDSMPPELYRAMCKLGRLYIEEGLPDRAACVHLVLDRARYPLDSEPWALKIFQQSDFRFRGMTLIDAELRVPTSDCVEIGNLRGSFGEDNVIETRLHQRLRESTERLKGRRQHKAYTAVRSLLGSRSLIGERELLDYLVDHDLTPLQGMIIDTFFDRVPEIWFIEGRAHRCAHCGTLMRPHPQKKLFPQGRCPIRLCPSHEPSQAKVSEAVDPNQDLLLIAKPQILTYWTGPAIDELAIFEAAKENGLDAELYPESDRCDVAITDYNIGIDAKSYTSPVSLALRLNRGIGGLIYYHRRIITISDQLIQDNPDYLSTLKSTLDKKNEQATLEIMPVSQVIQLLKEISYAK